MELNTNLRAAVAVAAGVLLLWIAAQFDLTVPFTPIRHSAQTIAVIVIGCVLGRRLGVVAVLAYLLVGLAGAPVFSHGGAGWLHLSGPTGGFLVGFAIAAGFVGAMTEGGNAKSLLSIFVIGLLAHAVILLAGWLGLLGLAGPKEAYAIGIAPFLDGALLKSILVVPLVVLLGFVRTLPWRRRAG